MRIRSSRLATLACILTLAACCGEESDDVFTPDVVTLREVSGSELKELVDDQLTFRDAAGVEWTAPKGTRTDGASVPRLALWVTDGRFDRAFLKAAIVHDAYCQDDNETRCPDQYRTKDWQAVHRMFHEACLAGGTSKMQAAIMFVAVWLGGPRWDDPVSDLEIVPDEVLRLGFDDCTAWVESSEPDREQIESWLNEREPTFVALARFEMEGDAALQRGDPAAVDAAVERADTLLAEKLEAAPNDTMLLNLRGRLYRNQALQHRMLDMEARVDEDLERAEHAFLRVAEIRPDDPGALNGLAAVSILRNDLDEAELSVRRVLEVTPEHPIAVRELEEIERLRRAPAPE